MSPIPVPYVVATTARNQFCEAKTSLKCLRETGFSNNLLYDKGYAKNCTVSTHFYNVVHTIASFSLSQSCRYPICRMGLTIVSLECTSLETFKEKKSIIMEGNE